MCSQYFEVGWHEVLIHTYSRRCFTLILPYSYCMSCAVHCITDVTPGNVFISTFYLLVLSVQFSFSSYNISFMSCFNILVAPASASLGKEDLEDIKQIMRYIEMR